MANVNGDAVTVEINNLSFTYPGIDGKPPPGSKPLIQDFSLSLRAGSRCLLVGSNGAGKTTILKILGGKHMVEPEMVQVMGRSAFHDTFLTSSGQLSYLGGEWRRDVAFAGFQVSMQMDISAEKMIFGVAGIHPKRREELIKVLGIDLSWRMHKCSDGQRRRVQICMGLLRPFKVLLLDEITVDLDVLARANLLKFLKNECVEKGATIIYATHIFDGLEDWPSHIVGLCRSWQVAINTPLGEGVGDEQFVSYDVTCVLMILEDGCAYKRMTLNCHFDAYAVLLWRTVESWLRKERDEERKRRKERRAQGLPDYERSFEGSRVTRGPGVAQIMNNGWDAGRLHSTVAGEENFLFSSNSVLRQ